MKRNWHLTLTLLLILGAMSCFDAVIAQEPPKLESNKNFVEFSMERLDVHPGDTNYVNPIDSFGSLGWTGLVIYHGNAVVRVREYDLKVFVLEFIRLSDISGRVWEIERPLIFIDPIREPTPLEEYAILLRPDERLAVQVPEIEGRLVLTNSPNQEFAGGTNKLPSELKYFLKKTFECVDEQGNNPGKITFSGSGTIKARWIKKGKAQSNAGEDKP